MVKAGVLESCCQIASSAVKAFGGLADNSFWYSGKNCEKNVKRGARRAHLNLKRLEC
jgi:hypothetical protein